MQQPADMPQFSPAGWRGPAGAPSPISSRPPAPTHAPGQQQQQQQQQMDELGAAVSGSGSGSIDGHEGGVAGGEEGERGGSSSAGNRWPRQETLALLKIRSEMDAAFREAALKGPLWEEVSRKLAELGYSRSAKKCREKFENVDKYYRRTKDGRTGRGDGKTYRFFTELEALHGGAASSPRPPTPVAAIAPPAITAPGSAVGAYSGVPSSAAPRVPAQPSPPAPLLAPQPPKPMFTEAAACVMTTVGDESFSDSDGEDSDETADGGKRKRRGGSGFGHGGKAMRFFEGLMQQVMERQEAMQHRLLEAIERRDQDRMIREEAWRRQEVARLAREQDALAQERAVAASRDAAVVSFIQRITGQMIGPGQAPPSSYPAPPTAITAIKPPPLQPTPVASAAPAQAPPTPRPPVQPQPNVTPMKTQPQTPQPHAHAMPPTTEPQQQPQPQLQLQTPQTAQTQISKEIVVHSSEAPVDMAGSGFGGASPSRWPKAEVHALIQLRTEMETRYQDTAPKGPLWEDISVGMRRLGYNRSSKRCKEKWENINKYFKKVKESSKKRPEDSKTCPYFHQLDALYRTKALASSSSGALHAPAPSPRAEAAAVTTVLAPVPLSSQTPPAPQHVEHTGKTFTNGNGNGCASNGAGMQVKTSNGAGIGARLLTSIEGAGHGGNNGTVTNKPEPKQQEGITKETTTITEQPAIAMNHNYGGAGNDRRDVYDMDSDSMDDDEDDFDDEDDEDDVGGGRGMPVQYDTHFLQRQQQQQQNHNHGHNVVRPNAANGGGNPPTGNAAPAAAATSGAPFLAMVQ
ncbi:hypothetical protein QYE76_071534 [Lolium multiflorum]|uniref:Myb-like domain-containing protein n=1 Tax=Lolium multiflorum TaxID=4521 RepID=A0AAD8SL24_LOLMU|nr:hypothetical protein QYE76_071534 [Lolium multiflorum]